MTALLWIAGAIVYMTIGYLFAKLSLSVWIAKDNRSRRAFLLFPMAFFNQKVGHEDAAAPVNVLDIEPEAFKGKGDVPGRAFYMFVMWFVWPLKFLFNVPFILTLALFVNLSRTLGTVPSNVVHGTYDYRNTRKMYKDRRAIVAEIDLLKAAKARLDKGIAASKQEATNSFKYEDELDQNIEKADIS